MVELLKQFVKIKGVSSRLGLSPKKVENCLYRQKYKYMSIITSIKVSPLSISANLIGMSYDNFYISKIIMKDGTVYDANEFNGSASSSFLKGYTSVEFNKVIDLDNIKSITIGNEVFEINK